MTQVMRVDRETGEIQAHSAPSPVAVQVDWDRELRGAQMLVRSGLCPRGIQSAEAALFVILAGRDLGLSAVTALRNIRPVEGKLEVSADLQLGLFHRAGGRSRWLVLTDQEARIELRAPWLSAPHVASFTIADAQRALLASKDNWKKYPKAMLRSRVITSALKDSGFDATAGLYAPGEISGDDAAEAEVVRAEVIDREAIEQARPVEAAVYREPERAAEPAREWRLPGKPEKWGGNGGKPITEVSTDVLQAAGAWLRGKADNSGLADAIAVELDVRAQRDEDEAARSGVVPNA